jgi:hypothetical protein
MLPGTAAPPLYGMTGLTGAIATLKRRKIIKNYEYTQGIHINQ